MPRIHFLSEDLLVEAPAGTSLVDVVEASGADVTFGCKGGACGTCRVRIVEGASHCSEPSPEERDFLRALGTGPEERLACQITLQGDIGLEYV